MTVVINGRPFEVTTLREDVETFGRKARVCVRPRLEDGRASGATSPSTRCRSPATAAVHDYTGGLADLDKRRIRFIGDPAARIAEDYLRILRFFRFHAHYGEGLPDHAGLAACIAARAGLATLSRERVRAELLKLLLGRHAVPVLAVMSECGMLIDVLGGVAAAGEPVEPGQDRARRPASIPTPSGVSARSPYLCPTMRERLAERLRLANVETERLASMGEHWRRSRRSRRGNPARAALSARPGALHRSRADRVVALGCRDRRTRTGARCCELPQHWIMPVFPIKAADFMSARDRKGTGARRSARGGGRGLDRRGFSGGRKGDRGDRIARIEAARQG